VFSSVGHSRNRQPIDDHLAGSLSSISSAFKNSSVKGVSKNAQARIRIFHIRDVATIVTLTKDDITRLIDGEQLVGMLQEKYEELRFHQSKAKA
jgi:hypothetical protein